MNSLVEITHLTNDELDRLHQQLAEAIRIRRQRDAEPLVKAAGVIGQTLGHQTLDAQERPTGFDYAADGYVIELNSGGYPVTIAYQGEVVWNSRENVFIARDEWINPLMDMAQKIRQTKAERQAAATRVKLLTTIEQVIVGTEFTSITAALEHFQLGPFEPRPEHAQVEDDNTDGPDTTASCPSPDDIRRQILLAGLQATDDPELRIATLHLIRQQFGLHMHDAILCQAVVAHMVDEAEFNEVRREAVATAWHWINWRSETQTITSQALGGLMNKGGAEAQLVIAGMALLGKGDEPPGEDE
ncbi:MAG: hypothetical protein HY862_03655 [Chloroflexi bacterium]|nr:hypothetical protein [Chloroflexota bacterium]